MQFSFVLTLTLILSCIFAVRAFPSGSSEDLGVLSDENLGVRHRRVTCDILSVNTPFGSLNHSACAAHCIAMNRGFRGGHCNNGVCHCRK